MKNLQDLMTLITKCVEQNGDCKEYLQDQWMIDFSGHVNSMRVDYYQGGYDLRKDDVYDTCRVYLTEDGIQEMYWFIANRLK